MKNQRPALNRRILGLSFIAAAALASATGAWAQPKPIVIGLPIAQSGPAGVADHADYLNGAKLAAKEINAAGGVNGRKIELKVFDIDIMTPEGTQATFRKMVDAKVQAIASPFVLIPTPALFARQHTASIARFGQSQPDQIRPHFPDRPA
jgi:branched-chain amino acid transport system substrate-binding protein